MSAMARVTSFISEVRVEFVFATEDSGLGGPGFKSRCFLRQGTYERAGILLVEVYERFCERA